MSAKTYKPAHGGYPGIVWTGYLTKVESRLFDWELFHLDLNEARRSCNPFHGGCC